MDVNLKINNRYFFDKKGLNFEKENTEEIQFKNNITNSFNPNVISLEKKYFSGVLNLDINSDLIDRKISSDSTSISNSLMENLSQTSESSCIYSSNNNLNNNSQKEFQKKEEESYNYFFGIEKYFFKIMPEKFNDYKKSKNFLPKSLNKQKEEKKDDEKKENEDKDNNCKIENHNMNKNLSNIQNNIYYPTYGNLFYLPCNPFCFNYQLKKTINNDLNKIDFEDKISNQKQLKHENKLEKKEDKDVYYEHKSNDEQDVYILEKQKSYNIKAKQKNKEKNKRNNYNDDIIKNSFYNIKNCNYKFNNFNSKYHKTFKNNFHYQVKENKYEQNKNHYNYKKYNQIKYSKVIYY